VAMATFRPAGLRDVKLGGAFWTPRLEANRRATIPAIYRQCARTGRLDAWKRQWQLGMPHKPHIFWDSDVAKWLEAASYALATKSDPRLARWADRVADTIVAAQRPDGYLNTYFTSVEPDKRWTNLRDNHELYCAGHLMEAGVAHYEATGERKLLHAVAAPDRSAVTPATRNWSWPS